VLLLPLLQLTHILKACGCKVALLKTPRRMSHCQIIKAVKAPGPLTTVLQPQ